MFGFCSPISYCANLNFIMPYFYPIYSGWNCNPWMPFFNLPWTHRNVVNQNYDNHYQNNNRDSNVFALNQLKQYSFRYSDGGIFNYASQTQVIPYILPEVSPAQTKANDVANPVKTHTTEKETNTKLEKTKTTQAAQMSYEKTDLGNNFIKTAKKYSDCKESDGSHHKFCVNPTCKLEDPYDQEWCTDFVTYVVNETYKTHGMVVPSGFGSHDVKTMKNWAIDTNRFIRTSNKSKKAEYIAENIMPGDIIIFNENNASHTGFVTKIDKNTGTIHTIEGNRDDKVSEYAYSPNLPDISGFIRLTS